MIKQHIDPRKRHDALTNQGVGFLVLLSFGMAWIIYTQVVIEYDIEPDAIDFRITNHPHFIHPAPVNKLDFPRIDDTNCI